MTTITLDTINDATGFANGEKFTSAAEVREYFTIAAQEGMFGKLGECGYDQSVLTAWADAVIRNGWHMA